MEVSAITSFLAANAAAAPFVATALAAAETTAFLSVLIPSTALLVAVGAAVSSGALTFLPIWAGATIGAIAGSTLSFAIGRMFGERILAFGWMQRHAAPIQHARDLFARWGLFAIVLGHFLGPLRPVVFLLAGVSGMKVLPFVVVNTSAAAAWAFMVPKSGELGGDLLGWLWGLFGA